MRDGRWVRAYRRMSSLLQITRLVRQAQGMSKMTTTQVHSREEKDCQMRSIHLFIAHPANEDKLPRLFWTHLETPPHVTDAHLAILLSKTETLLPPFQVPSSNDKPWERESIYITHHLGVESRSGKKGSVKWPTKWLKKSRPENDSNDSKSTTPLDSNLLAIPLWYLAPLSVPFLDNSKVVVYPRRICTSHWQKKKR